MHNYEIKIKVEINKTKESITNVVNQHTDRSFRLIVSNESAHSIDQCEKALLSTHYPAIRNALSSHLSELTKEEAQSYGVGILKKTLHLIM